MAGKREQLETLNMWGQKLTREEGLTNTDKDNIHKDLALINERFNKVKTNKTIAQSIFSNFNLCPSSVIKDRWIQASYLLNICQYFHILESSTNVIFTSEWGSLQLWEIIIDITSVHTTKWKTARDLSYKKSSFVPGCWQSSWEAASVGGQSNGMSTFHRAVRRADYVGQKHKGTVRNTTGSSGIRHRSWWTGFSCRGPNGK